MMNKTTTLVVSLVFAVFLISCKKSDDASQEELGYSYYPINVGDVSVFKVLDTSFQGVGVTVIDSFLLVEEVHEPIVVNDETRYQLYRYRKPIGSNWRQYPDTIQNWTVFKSNGRIVKVEDNVRFVKLVFPLEVGKQWDGNISDPENDPANYYSMVNVRRPYSFDASYFPSTVSVLQFANSSAIDKNYGIEVYSDNQGMVFKEILQYKYDQSALPAKIVELGQHTTYKLLYHGRYK